MGKTGVKIACNINTLNNTVGVELYMHQENAKEIYYALEPHKDHIETELGFEVQWQALEGKQASRIVIYRDNSILSDESTWPELTQWLAGKVAKFDNIFRRRLKEL